MDGVDPNRRELCGERDDHPDNPAIDGGDRGRAGIRPILGQPAEHDDRALVAQTVEQRVDHLRVADQLQRYQAQRPVDVVLLHPIVVAVDGDDDQISDRTDRAERRGNVVRPGEVQRDPGGPPADLVCCGSGSIGIRARNDDLVTGVGVVLRDLPPDPAVSADHDDTSLCRQLRSSLVLAHSNRFQ